MRCDPPCIVVDFRRSRIRIFRSTLRTLGTPDYIRLLVNPEARIIAVQVSSPHDTRAHNVIRDSKETKKSCEIHSLSLLRSLLIYNNWEDDKVYKLTAAACLDGQLIAFKIDDSICINATDLATLQKVEEENSNRAATYY